MWEWFNRLRKRPPKPAWEFPQVAEFDFPEQLRVFLISFSYDAVTTQMGTWLSGVLTSRNVEQTRIFRLHDNMRSRRENLEELLQDQNPRIELFCGHGSAIGLCGPPQSEVTGSILSDLRMIIYDIEMITETPSSMFAFCCQAGERFGRAFAALRDKQFMGFKGEIPFPLELYDDLKYLFQTVACSIIQDGRISGAHREMFLDRLDEIGSQSVSYENPTLIGLWLDEYRKYLAVYA